MKKLTKAQIRKIKKSICRVENFTSSNGNTVANQFIIRTNEATIFQSYSSIIAIIPHNYGIKPIILDSHYWDYSATTGKYRNQFLNEDIAETRKKIDSGKYQLADLN